MGRVKLKASSNEVLEIANLCWQSQVGVCDRDKKKFANMLTNSWRQVELVSILAVC